MGNNCGTPEGSRKTIKNYFCLQNAKFKVYLKKLMEDKNSTVNHLNDSVNLYGDTILHYAVFHKNVDLIKFLLENKADPKIQNKRGISPFDLAKKSDDNEVKKLFSCFK